MIVIRRTVLESCICKESEQASIVQDRATNRYEILMDQELTTDMKNSELSMIAKAVRYQLACKDNS